MCAPSAAPRAASRGTRAEHCSPAAAGPDVLPFSAADRQPHPELVSPERRAWRRCRRGAAVAARADAAARLGPNGRGVWDRLASHAAPSSRRRRPPAASRLPGFGDKDADPHPHRSPRARAGRRCCGPRGVVLATFCDTSEVPASAVGRRGAFAPLREGGASTSSPPRRCAAGARRLHRLARNGAVEGSGRSAHHRAAARRAVTCGCAAVSFGARDLLTGSKLTRGLRGRAVERAGSPEWGLSPAATARDNGRGNTQAEEKRFTGARSVCWGPPSCARTM